MKGITSVLSFCVLTFFATASWAQDNACDGFIGAAFGLCNAYCEAMDCDGDEPNANEKACGKVSDRFMNQTGELPPCEVETYCPCFTSEDLQGEAFQCGENFPGLPGLAGIFFESGNAACSGPNCVSEDIVGCAILSNSQGDPVVIDNISVEENDGCQALIMASCDTPNAPVQSALQAGSNGTSVIPFIDR